MQFQGIIVEGTKDTKLYGKFTNHQTIKIKEAFGNEKVKKVIEILIQRGFNRTIGIIDADFKRITGEKVAIDSIFMTDDHDIEVMVIKTKALQAVLNIFCADYGIKTFEKEYGISIRNKIFNLGIKIGYLKLANQLYNLGLVFKPKTVDGKPIKYKKFICDKTMSYLGDKLLVQTAIEYSVNRSEIHYDEVNINKKLLETKNKEYPSSQLVNGHDLTNILFILMKKILKSKNKMLQDANSIEDSLTLAYEFDYFRKTRLYEKLKNWSDKNDIDMFNIKDEAICVN